MEHKLVREVYAAKADVRKADQLIRQYLPFIQSELSKFLTFPAEQEDGLSIAMLAFHQAIGTYEKGRGAFLPYASTVIRSRLVDWQRSQRRHNATISLEALGELPDLEEDLDERQATAEEIRELEARMKDFGVSFGDVAAHCPKQQRTLALCRKVIAAAVQEQHLLSLFLKTKKLPLHQLVQLTGADRKTLERHRHYLVVMLLIHTNGFELLRGHLYRREGGGVS